MGDGITSKAMQRAHHIITHTTLSPLMVHLTLYAWKMSNTLYEWPICCACTLHPLLVFFLSSSVSVFHSMRYLHTCLCFPCIISFYSQYYSCDVIIILYIFMPSYYICVVYRGYFWERDSTDHSNIIAVEEHVHKYIINKWLSDLNVVLVSTSYFIFIKRQPSVVNPRIPWFYFCHFLFLNKKGERTNGEKIRIKIYIYIKSTSFPSYELSQADETKLLDRMMMMVSSKQWKISIENHLPISYIIQ